MNKWSCDHPGCQLTCIGTGGAVGLRAIGWWFRPGMADNCFCPLHRPDPIACLEQDNYPHCAPCAGEMEADKWQEIMNRQLGFQHSSHMAFIERMRS